jgi:hypothetical protein
MGRVAGMASQEPLREGTVIISWKRLDSEKPDPASFDWDIRLNPPGLPDEDLSRLLADIAERF